MPRKAKADAVDMAESIRMLKQRLEMLSGDPELFFEITIKDITTSSASAGDVRGPYEFVLESDKPTIINGLGNAAPAQGPGFPTWESYMDAKLALAKEESTLALERVNFKNETTREWEKIATEKARLVELEKEYNNDVNRAKKGAGMALKGLLDTYLDTEDKKGLGEAKVEVEQNPLTKAEKMCESIAENIADHTDNLEEIKSIGLVVAKVIKYPEFIPVFIQYKKEAPALSQNTKPADNEEITEE